MTIASSSDDEDNSKNLNNSDDEPEESLSEEEEDDDNDDEDEDDEDEDDEETNESQAELGRVQKQCHAMMRLLKNLQEEEHDLQCQIDILARNAMQCGFELDTIDQPPQKRRKVASTKTVDKKSAGSKKSSKNPAKESEAAGKVLGGGTSD